MSELLRNIAPYVPQILQRRILSAPIHSEAPVTNEFEAAVLFADVSGFTRLTETLAEEGDEGPEELTRLLNAYFSRMIGLIEAEGGDVVKFSGDALTALFVVGTSTATKRLAIATRQAYQAAEAMQAAMVDFATLETSVGPVELAMKIGIGAGKVVTVRVGGVFDRWEYVPGGHPLYQAGAAQAEAKRGDIVLSPEAAAVIDPTPLPATPLTLVDWSSVSDETAVVSSFRRYVPGAILTWLDQGLPDWLAVLRPMSVVFVGIEGIDYSHSETPTLLHTFLRQAQKVVYSYQGSINKLAVDDKGSILLILFGAPPFAHEDDPLRAIRCALDLQAMMQTGILEESGVRLGIGVATGRVFTGPVGGETRREYTVMGDTVNLAARFMSKVGYGGILCDFDTYRHTAQQVSFEALSPVKLKGKASLVRAYRPEAQMTHRPRLIDAFGPMVGRQVELSRLIEAMQAVAEGESRIVLIEGEAGIGKSRLLAELVVSLQEAGMAGLRGYGLSIEQQTPYRAWREIFTSYFDLDGTTSLIQRQRQVEVSVSQVAPEQMQRVPLLNDVLNLGLPDTELTASMDPALRQQSLTSLLLTLLRAWAEEQPLIVILEDAHWLDSLSWELAVQVSRAFVTSDDPLLLVLATRPLSQQAVGRPYVKTLRHLSDSDVIVLAPLTAQENAELVATRLDVPLNALPTAVGDLVYHRSGGNPFFAEEMTFTLRDEGVITLQEVDGHRSCIVHGNLTKSAQMLPDTVQGLVLARVDRLTPEQQLVLKVASVIGRIFGYNALRYTVTVHTNMADTLLKTHLDALKKLDLTLLDAVEPDLTYIFKQIITQEVAYQTLLFAQRRQLHHTVAQWYESRHQGGGEGLLLASYYPLLVYHYHQAEAHHKERAYALLAGKQAATQYANTEAITYLSRALTLTPEDDLKTRYELRITRESVYALLGNREAQLGDLEALAVLADALDNNRFRAKVAVHWARYHIAVGGYPQAIASAQKAIAFAHTVPDAQSEASGYAEWGSALMHQSEYETARTQLEQALQLAQTAGLKKVEADSLRTLGIIDWYLGNYGRAHAMSEQAMTLYRDIGDQQGEGKTLNMLGVIMWTQGNYGEATVHYETALGIYREIGDRLSEGNALNNLGIALVDEGNFAGARNYYEQSLRISGEIGNRLSEAKALLNLGVVSMNLGDYSNAQTYSQRALEIYREIGNQQGEGNTLVNLALLYYNFGADGAAKQYGSDALKIAQVLGDRFIEGAALTVQGHVLVRLGEAEAAVLAYEQALAIRREAGQPHLVTEAQAGLAYAFMQQGDAESALAQVEAILGYLEKGGTLDGAEEPFRVYLTCYQILKTHNGTWAKWVLRTAYNLLSERAIQISDEALRLSFLNNVPVHSEIIKIAATLGLTREFA